MDPSPAIRWNVATTRWSVVLAAGGPRTPDATEALEQLCAAYWYPLYAFARRRQKSPDDAADLVQGFFGHVLATEALQAADPERGRFRAFLLTAFRNYMVNDARKDRALKRGGGQRIVSLDVNASEARLGHEPSHDLTPDQLYLRDWALSVLHGVLAELRTRYEARGQAALFDALKEFLTAEASPEAYAAKAEQLGKRKNAIAVAVHRLRQRYQAALREAVAQTAEEGAMEDEVRDLLSALRSS